MKHLYKILGLLILATDLTGVFLMMYEEVGDKLGVTFWLSVGLTYLFFLVLKFKGTDITLGSQVIKLTVEVLLYAFFGGVIIYTYWGMWLEMGLSLFFFLISMLLCEIKSV